MINKKSQIPVYIQLKDIILSKIKEGVWLEGECIASERELVESYGVSRMTIRQALGELVQEGILIKKKGIGTFVCKPKFTQKNIMSFSEIIEGSGRELRNAILDFEIVKTPEELSCIFEDENLFKINRNRIVDGQVIANELIYMPKKLGSLLCEKDLNGSIYKFLKGLNQEVSYCDSSINAILVTDEYKKLFDLNENAPLLQVNNKVYNKDGSLLFVEIAMYRSDKYTLEINISKREGKLE